MSGEPTVGAAPDLSLVATEALAKELVKRNDAGIAITYRFATGGARPVLLRWVEGDLRVLLGILDEIHAEVREHVIKNRQPIEPKDA